MTESTTRQYTNPKNVYDPVRALVCEDCCSEIAGCSHSFDEIFEWGRMIFQLLLAFTKYFGMVIFSIQMFFLWLFPKEEIDPIEEAHQRQKRVDLALIADRQAQIRIAQYEQIKIYDPEPLAKQKHLDGVAAGLLSSLGDDDVDPGLVDVELRKVRHEQIALAEQQHNLTAVQVCAEIDEHRSKLKRLNYIWSDYKGNEHAAQEQWQSNYWKNLRLETESEIKQTENNLRNAQKHFAIIG